MIDWIKRSWGAVVAFVALLAGVGWPFVLMWAYATPDHGVTQTDVFGDADLREEVRRLTEQVAALQSRLETKGGDG